MRIDRSFWYRYVSVAATLVLVAVLYGPALSMWAYGDDFSFLGIAANPATRWQLFSPGGYALRPVDRLINAVNVAVLGYERVWLAHLASFLGFLAVLWLVYRLAGVLLPNLRLFPLIASAYFAVLSVNVLSVIQIDTISQQYATLFCLLLFWWLLTQYSQPFTRYGLGATFWAVLALLSKETSFGLVLAIPAMVHLLMRQRPGYHARIGLPQLARIYGLIGLSSVAYLMLRQLTGATLGLADGPYAVSWSVTNLVSNGLQILAALAYWGSTVDIFPARQMMRVAFSTFLSVAAFAMMGIGLWSLLRKPDGSQDQGGLADSGHSLRTLMVLAVLTVAGTFPVIMIAKMSELYAYASSPFYALLVGALLSLGLAATRSTFLGPLPVSRLMLILLALGLAWLALGTMEKVRLASQVSQRAKLYYGQTQAWMEGLTGDNPIRLCWSPQRSGGPELAYSGFVFPDRVVMRGVVNFSNEIGSRQVHYEEQMSADQPDCEYLVTAGRDGLHFLPNQSSNAKHAREIG